ncbi:MAG TPA: lytic transglycosylase domain-containing protein [Stellaceae bacterium]|nr:lytic transglycosylase domain-containing protein [Stellaceae bacterium]
MAEEQLAGLMVAGRPLSPEIVDSLKQASAATGVDFDFLVAQASAESGLRDNVHARQRHSSASGLFQFTAQTWLQMMRDHGAQFGQGELAKSIVAAPDGHLSVTNRATERQILELRKDPKLAGIMAGELAKQNAVALQHAFHRKATPAELHLAHLLGATGAIRFLRARAADADQPAADVVPAAARQNPQLFYDRGDHTPHSVAAVYGNIKHRIETPLKQLAAATQPKPDIADGLRPGPGITDSLPKPPRA